MPFESADSIAALSFKVPFGGGSIIPLSDFFGSAITSLMSDPTSGLASEVGIRVKIPISKPATTGEGNGSLMIQRRRSPKLFANV
jgi:hypothetical protein